MSQVYLCFALFQLAFCEVEVANMSGLCSEKEARNGEKYIKIVSDCSVTKWHSNLLIRQRDEGKVDNLDN